MAAKEIVEITCRIIAIPTSRPSQFNEGKNWVLISTDKGKLSGEIEPGSVLLGCDYRCGGWWEDTQWGKTFKFKSIAIKEPTTRNGVIAYLGKYVPHVGVATAGKLCDKFGADKCVAMLRDSPEAVADTPGINGMTLERCLAASDVLKGLSKFEDTRIALLDIFSGRRFRQNLPDLCIAKWGSAAAVTVKANAFVLIEQRFPGCGFLLVDELYLALGGQHGDMRRQVYALDYVLSNLADNSTWASRSHTLTEIGKICSRGLQFDECINEAVKLNKVKVRVENGEMFLACKPLADQELMIAERLWDIAGGNLLSRAAEPVASEPQAQEYKTDARESRELVPEKFKSQHQDESFGGDDDDGLEFKVDASGIESEENYDEAIELIEVLDSLLEQITEIPAADDYRESVSEKMFSISETIEKRKLATERQIAALNNMISGCERWVEGSRIWERR